MKKTIVLFAAMILLSSAVFAGHGSEDVAEGANHGAGQFQFIFLPR